MATINDNSLTFFSKATPDQWFFVLNLYREVFKIHAEKTRGARKNGPAELIKLDVWFQDQLPKIIRSRKEHQLFYDEIVQVTKWKLLRGKFRPSLLDLVKTNTETAVLKITKKAFKKMPNISSAISALTTLKGIGLATASAILVSYSPDVCPYMADENMLSTPGVESADYTSSEYMNYVEQVKICLEKIKKLDPDRNWTPHKLELALWTHYQIKQYDLPFLNKMPIYEINENDESNNKTLENQKSLVNSSNDNLSLKHDDTQVNLHEKSQELKNDSFSKDGSLNKAENYDEDVSNFSSVISFNSLIDEQSHDSLSNKLNEENSYSNNINGINGLNCYNQTNNDTSLNLIYNNNNSTINIDKNIEKNIVFNLNSSENGFSCQSNSNFNINTNNKLNNSNISSSCESSIVINTSEDTDNNLVSSFNKKKQARYCLNNENFNLDDNAVQYEGDNCEPLTKRQKVAD